jgi:hypothetical protein
MNLVPPVKKLYVQSQKSKLHRFVKKLEAEKEALVEDVKLKHTLR